MPLPPHIRIGTAGWSIPRASAPSFPGPGTHLERYARILPCAEINTSFYRAPMPSTWLRWAASVPDTFRFSVKAPKAITHAGLTATSDELQQFLSAAATLGNQLGPLLFQLPPKFAFAPNGAEAFFARLRKLHPGPVALEPRHAIWFTPQAAAILQRFHIARVAADPPRVPDATSPIPSPDLTYFRLHGSPRIYYSSYPPEFLERLTIAVLQHAKTSKEVWVIFDNTASGEAAANALALSAML